MLKINNQMKMLKKVILAGFLFLPLILFYLSIDNKEIIISSIVVNLIIIYGFINSKSYSFNTIFFVFMYIFMGIVPMNDYINKNNYWGGILPTDLEYIHTNYILSAVILFYSIKYKLVYSIKKKQKEKQKEYYVKKNLVLIFFIVTFYLLYMSTLNFDFTAPFIRSSAERAGGNSQILRLIVWNVLRPTIVFSMWIVIDTYKFKNKMLLFITAIILLLGASPTGMARFQAGAFYFPIMMLLFEKFRKYFKFILIGSLFYVLPILDLFRTENINISNYRYNLAFLNHGHFDSYQSFLRVISNNVTTSGRQLLGVVFSWVPRSIWQEKPIGSGAYLAKKIGLSFENIAMNYFGEGYINFGYIGIFLFVLIIALVNASFDKIYWKNYNFEEKNRFKFYYFLLIMMQFFILRGDLMSSLTYTIGILLSLTITLKVLTKKFKYFI